MESAEGSFGMVEPDCCGDGERGGSTNIAFEAAEYWERLRDPPSTTAGLAEPATHGAERKCFFEQGCATGAEARGAASAEGSYGMVEPGSCGDNESGGSTSAAFKVAQDSKHWAKLRDPP